MSCPIPQKAILGIRRSMAAPLRRPSVIPSHCSPIPIVPPRSPSIRYRRTYASHHSSSHVRDSQSTQAKLKAARAEAARQHAARTGGVGGTGKSGFEGHESVGPFPLGVGPSGRSRGWKRWSDLGLGGKLGRMTRQTGNLSVIIVGGTLFVVLAFALTTELFATNSPSVLYSHAVDQIRASDALNAHLLPPLTFTHTPHPSAPIRGSPPIATRHIQHPRSGREHLILTFWVHGRGIGEEESLGWARRGYHTAIGWARGLGEWAGLVTESRSDSATEDGALRPTGSGIAVKAEETSGAGGWLGGLLGGMSLRGSQGTRREKGLPPPGTYTVGEVHGDYVKNASGQYQLLSLIIDVPGSSAPQPSRAVVFWSKEADTEGLLGKRIR